MSSTSLPSPLFSSLLKFASLALALWLGAAQPLHAQSATQSAAIAEIRELILHANYDEAAARATSLLSNSQLDAATRNLGLELLATAKIANRDEAGAAEVLATLYARDPGYRVQDPDVSPSVQAAFQRAREQEPEPVEVDLQHAPPLLSHHESPMLEVSVRAGADAVGEIRLAYRSGGGEYTRTVMVVENGVARARVPAVAPPGQTQVVQYYFVALSPSLTPLASLGSESQPMRLTIPAASAPQAVDTEVATAPSDLSDLSDTEDEASGGSKWWIGLLVGVIVVGAGVGGYFLFRQQAPDGTLGHAEF